jgi:hypothetical protein
MNEAPQHSQYKSIVGNKLTTAGFVVKSIGIIEEPCSLPSIGFDITIQGKETEANKINLRKLLSNFAYRLTFVEA